MLIDQIERGEQGAVSKATPLEIIANRKQRKEFTIFQLQKYFQKNFKEYISIIFVIMFFFLFYILNTLKIFLVATNSKYLICSFL